jgi:hypothetical protein
MLWVKIFLSSFLSVCETSIFYLTSYSSTLLCFYIFVSIISFISIKNNLTTFIWIKNNLTTFISIKNNLTTFILVKNNLTTFILIKNNLTTFISIKNNLITFISIKNNLTTFISIKNNLTTFILQQTERSLPFYPVSMLKNIRGCMLTCFAMSAWPEIYQNYSLCYMKR